MQSRPCGEVISLACGDAAMRWTECRSIRMVQMLMCRKDDVRMLNLSWINWNGKTRGAPIAAPGVRQIRVDIGDGRTSLITNPDCPSDQSANCPGRTTSCSIRAIRFCFNQLGHFILLSKLIRGRNHCIGEPVQACDLDSYLISGFEPYLLLSSQRPRLPVCQLRSHRPVPVSCTG